MTLAIAMALDGEALLAADGRVTWRVGDDPHGGQRDDARKVFRVGRFGIASFGSGADPGSSVEELRSPSTVAELAFELHRRLDASARLAREQSQDPKCRHSLYVVGFEGPVLQLCRLQMPSEPPELVRLVHSATAWMWASNNDGAPFDWYGVRPANIDDAHRVAAEHFRRGQEASSAIGGDCLYLHVTRDRALWRAPL